MAGINQGRPELAVGEPIRLGDDNDFEIEQHPVSDRLIIRDTQNGKVAYVRKERGGSIGGDGILIKALKEGKPMADDGRTYDTIQAAERAASAWVFVPPGNFNSVEVTTDDLTLKGSGYASHIDVSNTDFGVAVTADNVTVENLSITTTSGTPGDAFLLRTDGTTLSNITVRSSDNNVFEMKNSTRVSIYNCVSESSNGRIGSGINPEENIIVGCILNNAGDFGFSDWGDGSMIANNIITNTSRDSIIARTDNLVIGNRVIGSGESGIEINGSDAIVANNRVSDSTGSDINDSGTGTLLDANLTGASN